ncbi:glycosyltransferase [Vibrio ostreicida]|uniref:Glycosyltransferase n=1 Tax=Vibrio ostreicida TaxID=526588 RepID=A0ABT8BPV4_9VIBR|nr:glycosyltransferase [Vibrio ostreicida]MDN3608479.1 glycosyltransferase [Vibrio ostreicida]NPD10301.1 glycosyltransferase [Vibrio ostreicida]
MTKKLSIVIVTYNSNDVIRECLNSIETYNDIGDSLEVIIVDNSPVFEVEHVVNELKLKIDVRLIHNSDNGGFGQGNNIGVKSSNGELIFILNADTILIEPVFKFMLKEFEDDKVTAAGFRLVDRKGKLNNSFALYPEYNYVYFFLPISFVNFAVINLGLLSKYIFPWGADFVVRRKDFVKAGMFDESIFLCNEEPDLTKRLNVKKVKIFHKPIVHLEGHTTEIEALRFDQWIISTRYYFSKYGLDFNRFISNEVRISKLKIKVKKALGLDVKKLISYVNMIEDRVK